MLKKTWIGGGDSAVDLETGVGPAADPIAVVQIRVAGVAIAHVRFVMTAAGAHRARPTGVAICLRLDVAAREEIRLACAIQTRSDVPQPVRIGIDEAMARSNIARRPDAHQAEPGAARMRFADALMQLGER